MEYAKAWAAAAALVLSFVVGEVLIDLPETVTAAVAVLITPLVVKYVPNRPSSTVE
jgi:hypothetical protein